MKKNYLWSYSIMALFLIFTSCNSGESIFELNTKSASQEEICGESKVVSLIAGQHIDVGTVTVANDETYLYVTYETTGDWFLTETHLYVGAEDDIPLTKSGNPKIGDFTYQNTHDNVKSYTYKVELEGLSDSFAVVTHAVVDSDSSESETAFGCGDKEFPGKRWGCYFEYTKQECKEDCEGEDAFAWKPIGGLTFCFIEDGFMQWGWTQRFTHVWLAAYKVRTGKNYQFPLYAKAEDCELSVGLRVGYVEMEPSYNGSKVSMNVKYVITNVNYKISEVNLYFGRDKYPNDENGNPTVSIENYTYSKDDLSTNEFVFTNLDWPTSLEEDADIYVIPHAKICEVGTE